ncbi:MAG: AmmeMemoRadiSam system protein B [Thermoleophilia bacterium]
MEPIISGVRQAAVAGQFYPASPQQLADTLQQLVGPGPAGQALGLMAPHAGYLYSGGVAGEVYGAVTMTDTFVILGPNHTGVGPAASIMTAGVWRLPGGDAPVDTVLAQSILDACPLLRADESAHEFEHSIEVQLPFLQYLKPDLTFVPICLMLNSFDACREIGVAIAAAVKRDERSVLIIASSDMTHYESQATALEKDTLALARMQDLDPEGLMSTVLSHNISMCGVAPATVMLQACLELGAQRARLIRYATSGDVTGDHSQVVGYAGVIVS